MQASWPRLVSSFAASRAQVWGADPTRLSLFFSLPIPLVYLPFLAAWVFLSKRFRRIEEIARAASRIYCPIAAIVGFLCLITTIVLWRLNWDFEFIFPQHIHRRVFEVIDYSGGTIVVSAILLLTLLFLRLARSGEEGAVPEMTWLGCLLVYALHLGNKFLP
jgi:hypothetical protein